ncbi:DUF2059 domain-containing protein [Pseudooceanicola sp. LIPI14-2-Ac024]|uniref:DUF2059 domain-containing protein n=1 Tax=Pseudooceanicola sp. LIPI14-2-Ac024 TaxID=3344875 RepID=UPI0035CEB628
MRSDWHIRILPVALLVCAVLAAPLRAAPPDGFDRLWDALRLSPLVEIMQEEGLSQTEAIGFDYLPYPPGEGWAAIGRRIYDPAKMDEAMRLAFGGALGEGGIDDLVDFFESPVGARIVEAELDARQDFLDPAVEEEARRALTAPGAEDGRLALIDEYIAVNDLVELNVMGALNANFSFFQGLAEGGGTEAAEDEMLAQVWSQEESTRVDTRDWLRAYLHHAYAGLTDDEIRTYIDLSGSAEGQRLNRALFEGFEQMYDHIYYALGLAVADQMDAQDL